MQRLGINMHCGCDSRLGLVPISFFIVAVLTFFVTYIISVSHNRIFIYFPTMSDIGGAKPLSDVFGLLLSICSFFAIAVVVMRYVQYRYIAEYNEVDRRRLITINKIALALGCIAFFAITLIGAFEDWGKSVNGHIAGAVAVFGTSVIYLWFQTFLSYRMIQCGINSKSLCLFRLALTVIATVLLVTFLFLLYSLKGHNVEYNSNKVPKLQPGDHGFFLHVMSSACELLCALAVTLYLLSYSGEFNKIKIGFSVRRNDMSVLPFMISAEERTPLFYT